MSRTAGTEGGGAAAATEESDIGGRGATVDHRMAVPTRLSNHPRVSPSKVNLGHFLTSGNRLWHRGAPHKEDAGNIRADDFTFLESKFSGGASSASAAEANVTDELHTKDSKGEDSQQPPQDKGEHSGQHQHYHLRLPWQNALHSMRQQHQQHETEKQGKHEESHTQKVDGELQSGLPRQSAVDQQRLRGEGSQQGAAIKEDVSAQERSSASESTTYVPSKLNRATQEAEHFSEHPCGTSTCVHRRSSCADEEVRSSDVPSLVESSTGTVGGIPSFSTASSSSANCKKNVCEGKTEASSKRESIEDGSSGEESSKVANAGEDTAGGGEKKNVTAAGGGKDSDSNKDGCVTPGVLPDAAACAYASRNISDTSSRAAGPAPLDTEAKRLLCVSPNSLGGGDASVGLHEETLPPAPPQLPPPTDTGQSLPSPAVCPAPETSVASSPAVSAATPPGANELTLPAASAAASPSNVAPAVGRLRKSVGLLRGQHGRSPLKVDSQAKEGGGALGKKESTGSQAVQTAAAETARSAAGSSTDATSSSQTSRPSPVCVSHKLSSPLLLRQLRRRALRESQPCAAALDRSPAHAGGPAGVPGEKRKLLLHGPATRAAAQAGGKMGEAGRRPGLQRANTTLTDAAKGGGTNASSHAITAAGGRGTALRRSGGRRVSSLGASGTAVDGGGGHGKTVRFGSMSVHVYPREARIRSCSSDSLNFALTLDPAASDAPWTGADGMSERRYTHVGRDGFDYLDAHAAADSDDEQGDTEEEDEELARGHHGRMAGLLRLAGEGLRAGGAAAAEREPGRLAWAAATYSGNGWYPDLLWNPEHGGWLTGSSLEEEAGADAPAELDAYKHPFYKHGRSSSSSSFTLDGYPSVFEDIFGKPEGLMSAGDSRGKSDRCVNPLHPQQPTREDAVQACRLSDQSTLATREGGSRDVPATAVEHRPSLDRESDSGEPRAVAAAPGLPPTHHAGAATASGGLRMQGAEEPQRGASFQIRPASTSNASEPPAGAYGSSSVVKAEVTGAAWWRRLLSSSSSELEGGAPASKLQQRRKAWQELPDELERGKPSAAEAPRDITGVGLARQVDTTAPGGAPVSIAAGGCSGGNLPLVGETVRKGGAVSVADNGEQQRLKITQSGELGQEEKVPGQEPEGNDSNMHRTWFLKALFHKQIGWPELWMHGKEGRKGVRPVEKGMESPQRRVAGGPRRVYSDEYSLSGSSSTQLQRRQSEGAMRRGHGGEEIQRAELTLPPKNLEKEAVVSPSGRQAEPVRSTNISSALLSPVQVIERDSGKNTHEEQQQSMHSATPLSKIKQCSMDLYGSPLCVSCNSTLASTDFESKNGGHTIVKDGLSTWNSQGSVTGEQVPEQYFRSGVEGKSASVPLSASNIRSFPSSHSTCSQQSVGSKLFVFADAAAAQQHDVPPQEQQQQHLLHRHLQRQEHMPVRRQVESRSSVLSTSSAGRSHYEEEALCKAAEEAIARSATSMSAEEKENLKDILKGWCS